MNQFMSDASTIQRLRHDFRRRVFQFKHPKKFRRLQTLRKEVGADGYSFLPFDQSRSIFVHIPKAAGISIGKNLYAGIAGGHTAIRTYELVFSSTDFYDFFKFTFVRNPWDRLKSAYDFLRMGGMNDTDRAWAERNLASYASFEDFVLHGLADREILKFTHFIPQHQFLQGTGSSGLPVDFIGLYENLAQDFETVQRRISGNTATPLSHENKTSKIMARHYTEAYTEEMRAIVSETYKADIALFGYTFDNSSLQTQLETRDNTGIATASRR